MQGSEVHNVRGQGALLGRLEVPVNQGFWLHGVQVGHALGALQTPAHGVGCGVVGLRVSTVQDFTQRHRMSLANRKLTMLT